MATIANFSFARKWNGDSHSKTEKPTARRLHKARVEGQFQASRELVAATQFVVFIVIAFAWFPGWLTSAKEMIRASLAEAFHANRPVATFPDIASGLLQRAFLPLSIIGGLTALLTLTVHSFVTKIGFSLKKLTPDFGRFNPVSKINGSGDSRDPGLRDEHPRPSGEIVPDSSEVSSRPPVLWGSAAIR